MANLLLAMALFGTSFSGATEFYIAPEGNDENASKARIAIHHVEGVAETNWNMKRGSAHGFVMEVRKYPFKQDVPAKVVISAQGADGIVVADATTLKQGSRGERLYFPIPYQTSCKITAAKGWGAYYHFNYVTFAPGTRVPTFTGVLTPEDRAAVAAVNDFMSRRIGEDPAGPRQGEETLRMPIALAPGGGSHHPRRAGRSTSTTTAAFPRSPSPWARIGWRREGTR